MIKTPDAEPVTQGFVTIKDQGINARSERNDTDQSTYNSPTKIKNLTTEEDKLLMNLGHSSAFANELMKMSKEE